MPQIRPNLDSTRLTCKKGPYLISALVSFFQAGTSFPMEARPK